MRLRTALAALLVLSGAAALLHEVAWFRLLAPVAGVGAVPAALVAAGALLGMAAGAALGGRLADRAARPFRVLAAAEAAGAVLGLLVPPMLSSLGGLSEVPALAAATAIFAAAAVPWGATLPAAVRALAAGDADAGTSFRGLYAWNTAGALLGIAAGAAYLLEALGNRGTVAVASGAQALAAFVAFSLRSASPAPARAPVAAAPSRVPLLLAAAIAGAAGVGSQVAWLRVLAPILGAVFPVFAAVLAVHIGGIALGAAILGPRTGARPERALLLLAGAAAAATAGTPLLLGAVVEGVRPSWWEAWGDPLAMFGLRAGVAAALALPGVLAGAALFPWLVRAAAPDAAEAGRGSGRLLAANAAGAAAGGMAAALLLVPGVGSAGALTLCAAAYLAAGACVPAGRARVGMAAAAAALGLLALAAPPGAAAARDTVGALYSIDGWAPADARTLLAADGRNGQVLVRDREGSLEFWIEGGLEASDGPSDRLHLGLLGHLPLLLYEARTDRPARVALVGLGAGYTARAAEAHRPERLVIHELEPEVARAAALFRERGGGLPDSADLRFGDGRRALIRDDGPLDVLSSDPVHPGRAGSAFLYSDEYYRAAMSRLSPEGVLAQWLPLYQLHGDDFRLALRTFAASVPHPYCFLAGRDAILIGCREPLRLSLPRLSRALAANGAAPLRAEGLATAGDLLALLVLDPEGCRAAAGAGEINTDDRLLLELRGGWRDADEGDAARALLASRPADPRTLLDGPPDEEFEAGLLRGERFRDALDAWADRRHALAASRFAEILRSDPGHGFARRLRDDAETERAWELIEKGDAPRAALLARAVAARADAEPSRRLDAAEVLSRAGFPDEARAIAKPYADAHSWPRARRLAGSP